MVNINKIAAIKGEGSKHMKKLRETTGLPDWKTTKNEIDKLADKHGVGWLEQVEKTIQMYERYSDSILTINKALAGSGQRVFSSIAMLVDLQGKLLMLEKELQERGENPLENEAWITARKQLANEMQFIHKQGLDEAKFVAKVDEKRKDDDDLFVVEVESDK